MSRLILVSNRLPYRMDTSGPEPALVPSVGGVATGLWSVAQNDSTVWIGWNGGEPWPDSVLDEQVVPVHLSSQEIYEYYQLVCNDMLWPLFHGVHDKVVAAQAYWPTYLAVNQRFADAVLSVWQPGDRVFVQDFHLMVLPRQLKARQPECLVRFFLHIPFPKSAVFETMSVRHEIVAGLNAADSIGVHTCEYRDHMRQVGVAADIRIAPLGLDLDRFEGFRQSERVGRFRSDFATQMQGQKVVLSVERIDYTKGILARLAVFRHLLDTRADLRGKLCHVMVAIPSRTEGAHYARETRDVLTMVDEINQLFGSSQWCPIRLIQDPLPVEQIVAWYQVADVLWVHSLKDGLNLVCKEYVAVRNEPGVVMLSRYAGASDELSHAVLMDPHDADDSLAKLVSVIEAKSDAVFDDWEQLLRAVKSNSIALWMHRCWGAQTVF